MRVRGFRTWALVASSVVVLVSCLPVLATVLRFPPGAHLLRVLAIVLMSTPWAQFLPVSAMVLMTPPWAQS